MTQKIHTLNLDLSMKLMNEISKIDRFDAEWTGIERREGASLKQLKSIATVRSVGASTRIEGSKMTDKEVEILIDKIQIAKLEERDQQEVAGYFKTLDIITENYRDIQIREGEIKNLHKILMQYSEKDEWHRGNYKQHANSVDETRPDGSKRTIFQTTEPGFPTENAMQDLFTWYNSDKETLPIIKIALFVYDFLSIHPFQDGNGRLSRLLGTLLLLKSGYSWIQYISFEHEIENRKVDYYGVLMHTQRQRPGENVSEWLNFFMDCLLRIQNQLEKLKTQQSTARLGSKDQLILSFLENNPYSKSSEIAEKLGFNLPAVKKILNNLLINKTISKVGAGKSTSYINETSKMIKTDVQFILTNENRSQSFQLNSPVHEIVIKKIILQPKFNWSMPTEWGEKANHQHIGFKIHGKSKTGATQFSSVHTISGLISDMHYQPVFELEAPIQIPYSIIDSQFLKHEYPVQIEVELTTATASIDFDVHFIYDAVL